jgi:hypothetical protein
MAHFAKLDTNNIVQTVVVVNNDVCGSDFPSSESVGQQFLAACGLGDGWKQTSYNGNFRGKYAGIGDKYDAEADEFVSPVIEVAE